MLPFVFFLAYRFFFLFVRHLCGFTTEYLDLIHVDYTDCTTYVREYVFVYTWYLACISAAAAALCCCYPAVAAAAVLLLASAVRHDVPHDEIYSCG